MGLCASASGGAKAGCPEGTDVPAGLPYSEGPAAPTSSHFPELLPEGTQVPFYFGIGSLSLSPSKNKYCPSPSYAWSLSDLGVEQEVPHVLGEQEDQWRRSGQARCVSFTVGRGGAREQSLAAGPRKRTLPLVPAQLPAKYPAVVRGKEGWSGNAAGAEQLWNTLNRAGSCGEGWGQEAGTGGGVSTPPPAALWP